MSPDGPFRYRADVLEQLRLHGVHPNERTRPALIYEFVSDLYRYELRRLRDRLLQKDFPKHEYYGRVVELPREDSGKIFKRRLRDPWWRATGRRI